MDILKDIIEPINSKAMKTKEKAEELNISLKELKQIIKDNGYVWRGSQYIKATEEYTESHTAIEKVKVTYRIDKELYRLIKIQSIIEDTDNSDIIEKAVRSYISSEAHSINEQIKRK